MTWWYTDGWRQCLIRVKDRIASALDFFSIGLLFKTLFSPFRQIAAGNVKGPLDVQIRAFFDRLVSRCIGAVVRLIMISVGCVVILVNLLFGGVMLIFWALIPILPLVGLTLYLIGWLPWIT